MLRQLFIRNLALIRQQTVTFGPGFNVITGETGAGKTMLVQALSLVAGSRADSDAVRSGENEAEVVAHFDIPAGHAAAVFLAAHQLADAEGGLIVRRVVGGDGRSRAWINDRPATVGLLKQLGEMVVDLSGQHEHQSLLEPARHLDFLDASAGALPARQEVGDLWRELSRLRAEKDRLRSRDRDRAQREDFLRFQVREIEALRLEPGEDERLRDERKLLRNLEKIRENLTQAAALLYGEDHAAVAAIGQSRRLVEHAVAGGARNLADVQQMLRDADGIVAEAGRSLETSLQRLTADPGRLDTVELRLSDIDRIGRKHGPSADRILERLEEMRQELAALDRIEADESALDDAIHAAETALLAKVRALSAARQEASRRLGTEVTRAVAALSMPRAVFAVAVTPLRASGDFATLGDRAVGPTGADEVQFLFSANPGEEPRALERVASGGELSRLLLGVKTVLHGMDPPLTLLFDEVDAGIGGEAARAVGSALLALASRRQVLCVTHLAQIAALGALHLTVVKTEDEGRAITRIDPLTPQQRVAELARMLSGDAASDRARSHAEELLSQRPDFASCEGKGPDHVTP